MTGETDALARLREFLSDHDALELAILVGSRATDRAHGQGSPFHSLDAHQTLGNL